MKEHRISQAQLGKISQAETGNIARRAHAHHISSCQNKNLLERCFQGVCCASALSGERQPQTCRPKV